LFLSGLAPEPLHEPDWPHPPHPQVDCPEVKERMILRATKKAAMATMATTMMVSSIWIPSKFRPAEVPDIHLIVMLRINVKDDDQKNPDRPWEAELPGISCLPAGFMILIKICVGKIMILFPFGNRLP